MPTPLSMYVQVQEDGTVIVNGTIIRPNGDVELGPGKALTVTDTDGSGNVWKIFVTGGEIDLQQQ